MPQSRAEYRLMQAIVHGAKPKGKYAGKKIKKSAAKEIVSSLPKGGYNALPEHAGTRKKSSKY